MGNFQGGSNKGGFRGGYGGKSGFQKKSFGGNRGGDRENIMHKAVCSDCSKTCEVPFRPTSDKPVFCFDCFSGKRDGGDRASRDFSNRSAKKDFNDRFAPQSSFSKQSSGDSINKYLKEISTKLDRLIETIERLG